MAAFRECGGCKRQRVARAFTHDDSVCNDCYTTVKKMEWEVYGTPWDRECKECLDVENTFTHFSQTSNRKVYSNTCIECVLLRGREHSKRRHEEGIKAPTEKTQIDFIDRFDATKFSINYKGQ